MGFSFLSNGSNDHKKFKAHLLDYSAMELSVKFVVKFESVHNEHHKDEITNSVRGFWCLRLFGASLYACMPSE